MVAKWLALSPPTKKVLGSLPGWWELHIRILQIHTQVIVTFTKLDVFTNVADIGGSSIVHSYWSINIFIIFVIFLSLSNRRGWWKNKDDLPRWRFRFWLDKKRGLIGQTAQKQKSGEEPTLVRKRKAASLLSENMSLVSKSASSATGWDLNANRNSAWIGKDLLYTSRSNPHQTQVSHSRCRTKVFPVWKPHMGRHSDSSGYTFKSLSTLLREIHAVCYWGLLVRKSARNGQSWSSGALCWACIVLICPSGPFLWSQ